MASVRSIHRIDEQRHVSCSGQQLAQKSQPLRRQFTNKKIAARRVATRAGEARNKTKLDRIVADTEHDWDRRRGRLGCQRRRSATRHGYHPHLPADQVGCQCWQSVVSAIRRAVINRNIPAFDVACLAKAKPKWGQDMRAVIGRSTIEDADYGHRLLRACRERPRRHAADKRDEIAASHGLPPQARGRTLPHF
jgi:hypothetical protein